MAGKLSEWRSVWGRRLGKIRRRWRDPAFWRGQVFHFLRSRAVITTLPGDLYWYRRTDGGCKVADEDWDTLLLLDCCRYDAFGDVCPESFEERISLGSATKEFVIKNFTNDTHHDIVYVTANPLVETNASDRFHAIVNLWKDEWNDEYDTVMPEVVADAVRTAHEKYPDKRVVGHFLQPHVPYIGPTGQDLPTASSLDAKRDELITGRHAERDARTAYSLLRHGEVSRDVVWQAYMESLEIAFDKVESLLDDLEGKTVVSADHGDLFGERTWATLGRGYGHAIRTPTEHLIRVPWWVQERGERKDVVAEPPVADEEREAAAEEIEEKLAHLGYVD